MLSRLLRYGIRGAPKLAERLKIPTGWMRPLAGSAAEAAKWSAKWVAAPLAGGWAIGKGFSELGSGIRSGLAMQTEEEKAKTQLDLWKERLNLAKQEFDQYKQMQNYLRTQADPNYNPTNAALPWKPEWMLPPSRPSPSEPSGKGFDFSMLLPVAAVGLIALALWKR